MVDNNAFRKLALSFDGTEENPHFDRSAFKVIKRRIFASLHEPTQSANMSLSKTDQKLFSAYDKKAIYPIPNKFGEQGWTTFELKKLDADVVAEALLAAYNEVFKTKTTPKKTVAKKKIIKKKR